MCKGGLFVEAFTVELCGLPFEVERVLLGLVETDEISEYIKGLILDDFGYVDCCDKKENEKLILDKLTSLEKKVGYLERLDIRVRQLEGIVEKGIGYTEEDKEGSKGGSKEGVLEDDAADFLLGILEI